MQWVHFVQKSEYALTNDDSLSVNLRLVPEQCQGVRGYLLGLAASPNSVMES